MQSNKFDVTGRQMAILNNMLNYLCHAIPFNSELLHGSKEEYKNLLEEIHQLDFANDSQLNFDLPKLRKLQGAFIALERNLKHDRELQNVVDDPKRVWALKEKLDEFLGG